MLLSSVNTVTLHPESNNVVAVLGGSFTFTCVPFVRYTTISWLSNGSMLDSRGQDIMIVSHPDARISTLTFYNLSLQYNGSRIQCALDNSRRRLSNEVTLLLIQG